MSDFCPYQPSPTPQGNRATKVVAGYGLHQRLGAGSFATVYKGIKVSPSTPGAGTVAIKAITRNSEKLTKKVLQNLEIEISILQTYRHRNIVCLQDVQKTERHFYLMLEYCGGGDLQQLIRTRKTGRLTERLTRRLMRDLSAGLRFLWRQELVHRDIKPQNLLLTGALPLDEVNDPERTEEMEAERVRINFPSQKFCLKIADFGFARHLQTASLAETLCGSPLYMAPEILQHHRYDAKADLWSVGTVLFEMIAGRPPFHGENHIDLLRNIQRKAVRLPPEVRVSKACVNLLRLLLNRNPLSRAGFKEFFEACDSLVALGCEGVQTVDVGTCRRRTSKNLGSIPEDAAAAATSTSTASIMTVQTTMEHQDPQQRQAALVSAPQGSPPGPNAQSPDSTQVSTPPVKPFSRNYPALQPLEPSPPVNAPIFLQPIDLPRMPALGTQQEAAAADQTLHQEQRTLHHYQQQQHILWQQFPNPSQAVELAQMGGAGAGGAHRNGGSPLQNSSGDDSGFVLVEHGSVLSPSATAIVSSAAISLDNGANYNSLNSNPQSYQRRSRETPSLLEASTPTTPPARYFVNSTAPTKTNIPMTATSVRGDYGTVQAATACRASKGMLSTSPGTGGALLGLLGRRIGFGDINHNNDTVANADTTTSNSSNWTIHASPTVSVNVAQSYWEQQIRDASKMLATAEDVGRRAVSVAHLGDARAYLALRLSLMNEASSLLSLSPMDVIVNEEEEANGAVTDDSSTTEIMTSRRRPRSVSNADKVMSEAGQLEEEAEAEEMPFACVNHESVSASVATGIPSRSHPPAFSKTSSPAATKHVIKPTRAMVRAHFKEALSCYLKTLQMLKGALTGAQKVEKDLVMYLSQQKFLSFEQRNRVQALQKRCTVTTGWLGGQFKGVLERADAASIEIGKLEVSSPHSSQQSQSLTEFHPVTQPEELIYNHSLACGREGAVKQLLGQFEAARSSYRSAGLLAETLLMEANIRSDDRKVLEGYVDGFAARITELDGVMLHQSRLTASIAGNSSTASKRDSGAGIVGLIGSPPPTYTTVHLAAK